jgi:putative tryptophan/tyrosine transport system substrate-binding protein
MTKKIILLALCSLLFAPCSAAQAQQPKKVPRIGYLGAGDPARESARAEAIRQALRGLGYIEGQNIAIEYRYPEGKRGQLLTLRPSWCVSRLISSW